MGMGETAIYIVDFYQYLYDQLESLNYIPKSGAFVFAHTPEASRTDENWVTWGETIYMGFQNSAMECKAPGPAAGQRCRRPSQYGGLVGCPGRVRWDRGVSGAVVSGLVVSLPQNGTATRSGSG